jgi:hypothetical protein
MSQVISKHRPGDRRQAAVSDLSKVILCLVAPRFEHRTLVVRAKKGCVCDINMGPSDNRGEK